MKPRMPRTLERYWALTRKEFQQVRRNGRMIIQLTIPPTILLLVLGFALNPEVRDMPTAVVDLDGGYHSREIAAELETLKAFRVNRRFHTMRDADEALARRRVEFVLVFPPGMSRDLAAGRPVRVQAIFDAVTANSAAVAAGHLRQVLARYGAELATFRPANWSSESLGGGFRPAPVEMHAVALYNPGLDFSWYYLSGLMAVIMFVDGSLVASAVAVREKEIGTIEQLLMSPAQSVEIILAKTTPVIALLVAGLMIARATAQLWFGLPLRGSFLLFLFAGILAAVASVGLGTLIGTFAQTQQQAQFLAFFINPPVVFLSGAFTRIENMPDSFQSASVFIPLKYFVTVVRDVSLKGSGLSLLWDELAILGAMGAFVYLVSAWRFRKQLN
jgi:ABC-2 type transport system permease protein